MTGESWLVEDRVSTQLRGLARVRGEGRGEKSKAPG
jgi:hypothetical protein